MHLKLADWYALASISHDAETLQLRWDAVLAVAKDLKLSDVPDLARIVYGRTAGGLKDRVKTAAKEADPRFLMEKSDAEVLVLSSAVAIQVLSGRSVEADATGLALVCLECQGLRGTGRFQDAIEAAVQYLGSESVKVREPQEDRPSVGPKDLSALLAAAKNAAASNDLNGFYPSLEAVLEGIVEAKRRRSDDVKKAFQALETRMMEESNILWWLLSEHTLDGKQPFSELSTATACFRAAIDLANLTKLLPGPFAAPAFLRRMVMTTSNAQSPLSLADTIESCDGTWRRELIESGVSPLGDLTPLLFGVSKAVESGDPGSWISAFSHTTGLDASKATAPPMLALQVYNEMLLLRALSE